MRIRMGKKIGIVAAICAAAAAGIAITVGVNSGNNGKENIVTDMESSLGKESLAEELINGAAGNGADGMTDDVSIADALGTEAGAAAGALMPDAGQEGTDAAAEASKKDDPAKTDKAEEKNTGTAAGDVKGETGAQNTDDALIEEIVYEDVTGDPETVVERRAVTGTKVVPVAHTELYEERTPSSGTRPVTPVTGDWAIGFTPDLSEGITGGYVDVGVKGAYDGPGDDYVDYSSTDYSADADVILYEKEAARIRLEEAQSEQEEAWAEAGYGTSSDRVGDDVFIVFE